MTDFADRAKRLQEDIDAVLATECGRRLVMRLVGRSGIFRATGPGELAYAAGRRDFGLEILNLCGRSPHYGKLIEETMKQKDEVDHGNS